MTVLDENGYPLDPYNEVIPGLAQAGWWLTPLELFGEHGFDVSIDVSGWDRSRHVRDRDYTFVEMDDAPWIEDADVIHGGRPDDRRRGRWHGEGFV